MFDSPIVGFAPDLPQDTPGIITSSSAIVPTERGIASGINTVVVGSAKSGVPCGGFIATKIDGTQRLIVGTPTKLWDSESDVSGTTYNADASQNWSFAQYGDVTLAVNKG